MQGCGILGGTGGTSKETNLVPTCFIGTYVSAIKFCFYLKMDYDMSYGCICIIGKFLAQKLILSKILNNLFPSALRFRRKHCKLTDH